MNKKELIAELINKYGVSAQVDQAIEEMAELTKALIKLRKDQENVEKYDAVIDEIADVQIMIDQLKFIMCPMDQRVISEKIEEKLIRQANRLKEKK